MAHDDDPFTRYEAAQTLATRRILDGLSRGLAPAPSEADFIAAFAATLADQSLDPALAAHALHLPSETLLAEHLDVVEPDEVYTRRAALRRSLGQALEPMFLARFQELQVTAPYEPTPAQIGARSLRNLCLGYLVATGDMAHADRAYRQATDATNMTDCLAALALLADTTHPKRRETVKAFYEKWKGEPLVVDKWFAIQAGVPQPETVEAVHALLQHPAFSLENPNKVRALLGAFAANNPYAFHRRDGAGYALLADNVGKLDSFNPQVAARMVAPLARWRRYDSERQEKMRAGLRSLVERPHVSRDVLELASKALADR